MNNMVENFERLYREYEKKKVEVFLKSIGATSNSFIVTTMYNAYKKGVVNNFYSYNTEIYIDTSTISQVATRFAAGDGVVYLVLNDEGIKTLSNQNISPSKIKEYGVKVSTSNNYIVFNTEEEAKLYLECKEK